MRFTIEAVSKMTGIPASSLRNWEKRYGFPQPQRSPSGHRFYSAEDVQFLKKAQQALLEGESLSRLAELYGSGGSPDEVLPRGGPAETRDILDDVSYRVELLYESLLKFEMSTILQHYHVLNSKLSPEQMFDRVIEAVLRRLGQDWQDKKISVAQEHYASAFLRWRLCSFLTLDFPATREQRILAATMTEERHEGGILLLAAHLKFRGYPVLYLGSDLPIEDLKSLAKEIRAEMVCVSYAFSENLLRDLPSLAQFPVPICVGGDGVLGLTPQQKSLYAKDSSLFFSEFPIGSEAANFVEMICRRERS